MEMDWPSTFRADLSVQTYQDFWRRTDIAQLPIKRKEMEIK